MQDVQLGLFYIEYIISVESNRLKPWYIMSASLLIF